jgi:chemotaxis receptor (MCP) glutamine deamidase CheD
METILIKVKDHKKTAAIKAILNAMEIEFVSDSMGDKEAKKIAKSIKKGLEEVKRIEEGKIKPISVKEFLDEL